MNKTLIILPAVMVLATLGASADGVFPVKMKRVADRSLPQAPVVMYKAQVGVVPASGSATVDFTVKGAAAEDAVWVENFDNGFGDWTAGPSDYVMWSVKTLSGSKGFSSVDPSDVKSLVVEGPYQTFRRETAWIDSPVFTVPDNGALHFWAGFSLNYEDTSCLSLSISSDNFETSTEIWKSRDVTGEKPWAWRKIDVPLDLFAGQTVRLRLTYGPGTSDMFGTGGYLGDYAIDNMSVTGIGKVDNVELMTGEKLVLTALADGDVTAFEWSFPGGVPAVSSDATPEVYYTTDGIYDISLVVTMADGSTASVTKPGFAKVTGTEPVVRIAPPASFRNASNGLYLVAPLAPVTFMDGSAGFPTDYRWEFTGVSADPNETFVSNEASPVVSYAFLHNQTATLHASNVHGSGDDTVGLSVEYSALATNVRADETATNFDMGDWGLFPGSNTRNITAFAEKFSKPSRPLMIDGVYVYFTRAEAEEVADQIANVGVHLCTSKDGKPDKRLDSFWWSVFELDHPAAGSTQLVGTAFPFTECPIVDDEFFIVIDGLPEKSETCNVAFAMAPFRGEGNTSYMLKDGEWIDVSTYFPAGQNHTSFHVYPSVNHSVMACLSSDDNKLTVGGNAGEAEFEIFSYMGYETPVSVDADWCRVVSEPNGLTVDTIKVEYDRLPEGVEERSAKLTLTDGASSLELELIQNNMSSGVITIIPGDDSHVDVFSLQGIKVRENVARDKALDNLPAGIYIVDGCKVIVR